MIKINLLPRSKVKKGEHPEIIALAQLGLFVVLVFYGVQYFMKGLQLKNVTSDLDAALRERSKYQSIINELNSIKAVTAELEAKKDLITTLMASRTVYPVFMEDLLGHFPKSMWLTGLNTQLSQTDMSISFTFNASALDIYTIADLVKSLESSAVITKPELGAINQSGQDPNYIYGFNIKGVYKKK